MVTQEPNRVGLLAVVASHRPAVAVGAEVLARIEAEAGQPAGAADLDSVSPHAVGLGGILDDLEVITRRELLNRGQVGCPPVEVHGKDGASLGRDQAFG